MTEIPQAENFPESEIKVLEERIAKLKELPAADSTPPKDLVKQSIQAIAPQIQAPQTQPTADVAIPPDAEVKVQGLVDVAVKDGIYKANAAAQKEHPFIMDQFHDALTGKLYPELQKRGIVD